MEYLTKFEAIIICFFLSCFFVGSLYFFDRKKQLMLTRDHPEVIKKRFVSIFIVCVVSPVFLALYYRIRNVFDNNSFLFFFKTLGITYQNIIIGTIIAIVLVLEIFFGPLVVKYMKKDLLVQKGNFNLFETKLIAIRNVIVGPITEEFIFRSCMISAYYLAGFSNVSIIFSLPLFFGVAHAHHAYEYYTLNKDKEGALLQALLGTVFQFSYTTLFGWFATFLFLRTGNILSSICAHALCNSLGFPDINSLLSARGKLRLIFWLCYVAGLIAFIINMYFVSKNSLLQSFFWN